jgi:hypothetical protein
MSLVKWTSLAFVTLPAAEVLTFLIVAAYVGWFWAAIAFVSTSVLGVMLLRHSGRRNLARFAQALRSDGLTAPCTLIRPAQQTCLPRNFSPFLASSRMRWGPPCLFRRFVGGPRQCWLKRSWLRRRVAAARPVRSSTSNQGSGAKSQTESRGVNAARGTRQEADKARDGGPQ